MLDLSSLGFLSIEARNLLIRILLGVLALALIWLLRSALSWVIFRPIRAFLGRSDGMQSGELVVEIFELPIRIIIVAIGLAIAARIILIDRTTDIFVDHLTRTLIIIGLTLAAYNTVSIIVDSSLRLRRFTGISIEEQLLPFIKTALRALIIIIAFVIVLQEWDFDVSALIAGLGIGGLGISLAAQDTVANLFAFSTIVSDRPFVVGEFIKTADVEGTVDRVGSRTTRVRRADQAYVTIPNSKLTNNAILNWSRLTKRHMEFTLGMSYTTSRGQMRVLVARIREMLLAHEKVEPQSVEVHFLKFGDSSLDILIIANFYEPNMAAFRTITEEVNFNIMEIIEDLGLSIAIPSRSLHIENLALAANGNGKLLMEEAAPNTLPRRETGTLPPRGASQGASPKEDEDDEADS